MSPINTLILYPTILIHGIGGNSFDLHNLKLELENNGAEVYNIEIGNGKVDSIVWNINKQCQALSENIDKLSLNTDKINIIGVSQGGLLGRCYVERYSSFVKPVHSLITYATPHMGVYISWIDLKRLEYWKNPFKYQDYINNNDFLVYINNEKVNSNYNLYRDNLLSLDNFLVIWSGIDNVVLPLESTRFEYYNISLANTSGKLEIVNFTKSSIYMQDNIGLKELHTKGKMMIERYDCNHEDFKNPSCFNKKFTNQPYSLLDLTLFIL